MDIYPKAECSFLDVVLWNQGPGDLGSCPNSLPFSLDGGLLLLLSEPPLPHLRPSLNPLHLFTRHLPRHSTCLLQPLQVETEMASLQAHLEGTGRDRGYCMKALLVEALDLAHSLVSLASLQSFHHHLSVLAVPRVVL